MAAPRLIPPPALPPLPPGCQQIFNLLQQVNSGRSVGAVLRVAGGWVRDFLRGVPSNDIDIAIETPHACSTVITGAVFADHIAAFQRAISTDGASTISVVKTNPEKSKHIETAQMTLLGTPIEFCHLRADDYSLCQDNRIPIVRPGTPLEDALRRDFTVNSLFYNLGTGCVEDWTTGLEDMEKKVLRTPLPPLMTFLDDPLRLMRGIRFAGQLGYALDPSIFVVVAEHPEIVTALRDKVSRERLGIEVTKMLSGNDPGICLRLLHETKLLFSVILVEHYFPSKRCPKGVSPVPDVVAVLPPPEDPMSPTTEEYLSTFSQRSASIFRHTVEYFHDVLGVTKLDKGLDRLNVSLFLMLVEVLAVPAAGAVPPYVTALPANEVQRARLEAILTSSLKLPGRHAETVDRMITAATLLAPYMNEILDLALQRVTELHSRSAASAAEMVFVGPTREAIYTAVRTLRQETTGLFRAVVAFRLRSMPSLTHPFAEVFNAVDFALRWDGGGFLLDLPHSPPVLRGNELCQAIGFERRLTSDFLERQALFRLHHPMAVAADVVEFLKQHPQE